MRLFLAKSAAPHEQTGIHPALNHFAGESGGMFAHLTAYLGVLALFATVCVHLWNELSTSSALEPSAKPGWSLATRSSPAFAVSQFDPAGKTETYEIFRHPEGGRKDILHWRTREGKQDERPIAELEIYRPGGEWDSSGSELAEIAARIDPHGAHEIEAAGIIDSKFGMVRLLRLANTAGAAGSCLGFIKRLEAPSLQISGWSCQGDALPARRAVIGCMLNRLVLLTAGNEPKMAELFARAELKRGSCATASSDWVIGAENPRLRGAL